MPDANLRVPAEARDRLAAVAQAEGLSLRSYLSRLARSLTTPQERAERAERARAVLRQWNGYQPTAQQLAEADAELDRRLAILGRPAAPEAASGSAGAEDRATP
jgi:hypothetical protein